MSEQRQPVTTRERQIIRDTIYGGATELKVFTNRDGLWAADVKGVDVVVEGVTAADVLRRIANILEEC